MNIREREPGDLKELKRRMRPDKDADRCGRVRAVVLAIQGEEGAWIGCSDTTTGRLRRVRVDTAAAEDIGVQDAQTDGLAWTDSDEIILRPRFRCLRLLTPARSEERPGETLAPNRPQGPPDRRTLVMAD